MKATIEFEDELYRQLKATAALRGKKVRELVDEGVRMVLQNPWKAVCDSPHADLPLIPTSRKTPLDIPDDITGRLDTVSDIEGHAASLRQ